MNESSTPSTVSRVSFWSIAMMAIVDGYMAGAHGRIQLSSTRNSRVPVLCPRGGLWDGFPHHNIGRATSRTPCSNSSSSGPARSNGPDPANYPPKRHSSYNGYPPRMMAVKISPQSIPVSTSSYHAPVSESARVGIRPGDIDMSCFARVISLPPW